MDDRTKKWQERTALLLGDDKVRALSGKHILIAGLGGVGGYAAEILTRAGIGNLTIVDQDIIQPSNINRQLIATHSNIGKRKSEEIEKRLKDINPLINIKVLSTFLKDENIPQLLGECDYDFVVDAIDTISPKVYLIKTAIDRNIPIVSSMGAGAKTDPMSIRVNYLSKSYNCTLAKVIRKRLRKIGVREDIMVVFSNEMQDKSAVKEIEGETCKRSTAGTISYMPALFGCHIGAYVINCLIKNICDVHNYSKEYN